MSDARFASLKTDPRFRRPKKRHSKVVLDDRFKHLLGDEKKGKKKAKRNVARVDKYGRTMSETREKDDLRRFYRLEAEDGGENEAAAPTIIDYARGAVLMESSDEEEYDVGPLPYDPPADESGSDSDEGGFISLGVESKRLEEDEDDVEVDLDENTIAALDAQVADYAKIVPEREVAIGAKQTRRLAVVNLDWDYVRAIHLYKIFSSLVSPTAPLASAITQKNTVSANNGSVNVTGGKIVSVRVYPSEFGKKRIAKEEKEGPPKDLFTKKNNSGEDEEINEKSIFEIGTEADYDEDALRKYQLERLRYYYAIVECDTVETAAHVYNELEGTELERSANVFDLSFVPDDMTFDDEPRDEATQPSGAPYRAVEFVTDALRHSKVKLTWDEDDPERSHVLRRSLTKKEIEEADFRAYVASSSSEESEGEGSDTGQSNKAGGRKPKNGNGSSKRAERDKLRMLLLGGNNDEMPEGWGDAFDNKANRRKSKIKGEEDRDVDMEVTFTPGLSQTKNPEDENTLEKYQRKMKEKKKNRKDEARKKAEVDDGGASVRTTMPSFDDKFFGVESDNGQEEASPDQSRKQSTKAKKRAESSKAELALLAASDNPSREPAHFDMKAILKAEKQAKKRSRHKSKKHDRENEDNGPGETQDDFSIDVKDDRFTAIHEDHQFAIDPTNPQFRKTKSMVALLDERSKRQKDSLRSNDLVQSQNSSERNAHSLQSLVESVKRKSTTVSYDGLGKRRKLGKN